MWKQRTGNRAKREEMFLRLATIVLTATAVTRVTQAQVLEASDKEDTSGLPRVVFFRPAAFNGKGITPIVYCDLTKVAEVRNNTYFEVALSPGDHICTTQMRETFFRQDIENLDEPEELKIQVKSGSREFVSVRFKFVGMTHSTFRLVPSGEAEASKETKHSRPVKPEKQFIRTINRKVAASAGE
jgi:hypothetical protein